MDVAELQALVRCAEPLSVAGDAPVPDDFVAFNDLLCQFRERVVLARNRLVLGHGVEHDLANEIRLLAVTLPALRCQILTDE
jgi:hypothetical protein